MMESIDQATIDFLAGMITMFVFAFFVLLITDFLESVIKRIFQPMNEPNKFDKNK